MVGSKFTFSNFCHIGIDLYTGTILYVLNVSTDLIGIALIHILHLLISPLRVLIWCGFTSVMIIGLTFVHNIRHTLGPRQWFAAMFVFTIGSIPIIASTVRYTTVYHIIRDPLTSFTRVGDIELWSEIDGAFATYAACLPALRSLVRGTRDKGTGLGDSHGNGSSELVAVVGRNQGEEGVRRTELGEAFDEDIERGGHCPPILS